MINITIDPFLLRLGGFSLSWHGILIALGVLVTYLLFMREGDKQGLARSELARLSVWMLVVGLIGARSVNVIGDWQPYISAPEKIIRIQDGGASVTGAVLGSTLTLYVYARHNRISGGKLADIFAIIAPVGLFIGRTGCLIMGDVPGIPTHNHWGLVYWQPRSSIPSELIGVPTFPVPLILQLLDILLFGLGLWLSRKPLRAGISFAVFLMGYAVGRFVINFWQLDPPGFLGLKYIQWVAIAIFAIGSIVMASITLQQSSQYHIQE
jgi:phosphatidylglycerol---prolipoprotein diacylglyceryl transferase